MKVGPGECQVWWAGTDEVREWHRDLLNGEERERADAYLQAVDRSRFTVGCALSRLILGALTGVDPRTVPIERSCHDCGLPHGKPRMPGGRFHFSVSHSGGRVAAAVTGAGPVGVDVEARAPITDGLAPRVLAPEELADFETLDAPSQAAAFFTYWVRKEAVLKATGDGLRVPMPHLRVSDWRGPAALRSFKDRPGLGMRLFDLAVSDGYAAAVAVMADDPIHVTVHSGAELLGLRVL